MRSPNLVTALRRFLIGAYVIFAVPLLAIMFFGSSVALVRSVRLIAGIL